VLEAWIAQTVLQGAIIGQQQKTFTIVIQAADWIYVFHWDELAQCFAFAGKLAQHAIRLV
jgi:hypothetical protein